MRIKELLIAAGHEVVAYDIIPDEPQQIKQRLERTRGADSCAAVLLNGGTGLAARDRCSKIWTSYVDHADYCFLVVRTDPESKGRHGISVLLVPMDAPGIELREIQGLLGKKYFHEVFFSDCRVPVSCRLGPENDGWSVVTRALAYERVGAAHYQRAQRTLDATAARARELGMLDDPSVLERLGAAQLGPCREL